jgi:hypothetical protein
LLRIDLRAPLVQDRFKIAYRFAVRIAGDMKLRLPMAGETSDATVSIIASMAMETGGVNNSPRARAAVGAAV